MKLVHFSEVPVRSLDRNRVYKLPDNAYDNGKPLGFWVSDETEYGWSKWCKSQEWNLNGLNYAYSVTLRRGANILYLSTPFDIDRFTEQYGNSQVPSYLQRIHWEEVAKSYQGIIITPYQWERRLTLHTFWYYGWDCASGCIWDISAIESIKLLSRKKAKLKVEVEAA